jgi:hypothetical protein
VNTCPENSAFPAVSLVTIATSALTSDNMTVEVPEKVFVSVAG